jgi:hypothetical protein
MSADAAAPAPSAVCGASSRMTIASIPATTAERMAAMGRTIAITGPSRP